MLVKQKIMGAIMKLVIWKLDLIQYPAMAGVRSHRTSRMMELVARSTVVLLGAIAFACIHGKVADAFATATTCLLPTLRSKWQKD